MKILPGVSISRCVTGTEEVGNPRKWVKPYFGVRLGRHWFFPIGTGLRLNTADKIREDVKYVLWAFGVTGWIKAVVDVRHMPVRNPDQHTVYASQSNADEMEDGPEYDRTGLPVEPR